MGGKGIVLDVLYILIELVMFMELSFGLGILYVFFYVILCNRNFMILFNRCRK